MIEGIRMPHFKSGDLVVLKSGGPATTVDTVNTDIFDDNKITGIVCVWFVGEKLERVRFEQGVLEHAQPIGPKKQKSAGPKKQKSAKTPGTR